MITKDFLQVKAKINKSNEIYKGKHFSFVTEDITLPNGVTSEIASPGLDSHCPAS